MRRVLGITVAISLACAAARGEDWPQFRGPRRDGVSTETGLARSWPAEGPLVRWRVPLGAGYSGLSIAQGRVFTIFGAGKEEVAVALDAATGKELWRKPIDATLQSGQGDGPRSTPTVDGERVYVLSGRGTLSALSTAKGESLWSKDLRTDYKADAPKWGVSTSPLVEGKLLIVDVGGENGSSIVAFDKTTGREVWRSQDDGAGYAAPIAFTAGGVRQVVVFTATQVVSLAPADGTLQWRQPWKTSYDVNAATPIFVPPDRLFVSSGYDHGSMLLRLHAKEGRASAETVWETRTMKNQFSSSVLHEGQIYGFDDKTLRCIDVDDAETRWRARGFGHGSLLWADGHLIVLGDGGQLALIAATPAEYKLVSQFQPFEGKTWTLPSLADGILYLRDERELVAFDVSN